MPKKCLLIVPFFVHYRKHFLDELFSPNFDCGWEFELVGDFENTYGIKGIDPKYAHKPLKEGGYNWTIVKDYLPLGKRFPIHWQPGVIKRIFKRDYDAVIMIGSIFYVSYLLCIPFLKVFKTPIVFWTHGFLGKDNFFIKFLRHFLYIQAKACLLYGDRANKIMNESGLYKNTKRYVIYNSLDYSKIKPTSAEFKIELRKKLFAKPDLPVVVAVGRINLEKKINYLIEALSISKYQHEKDFNLLIIGDGPELETLKILAKKANIERNINFLGEIYGEEVFNYLSISNLSVIPGNVGLSAMHAMAVGIPVVSHDNFNIQMPEFEAIQDGVTGSFYEYKNINSLVTKIHYWIFENNDTRKTKRDCLNMIGTKYNIKYQLSVVKKCLQNLP